MAGGRSSLARAAAFRRTRRRVSRSVNSHTTRRPSPPLAASRLLVVFPDTPASALLARNGAPTSGLDPPSAAPIANPMDPDVHMAPCTSVL